MTNLQTNHPVIRANTLKGIPDAQHARGKQRWRAEDEQACADPRDEMESLKQTVANSDFPEAWHGSGRREDDIWKKPRRPGP